MKKNMAFVITIVLIGYNQTCILIKNYKIKNPNFCVTKNDFLLNAAAATALYYIKFSKKNKLFFNIYREFRSFYIKHFGA